MEYPTSLDFALLVSRVWIVFMVFMHGWRHLKSLRSGPGMANWFESLGLKPGWMHAQMVTFTELALPVLLVLGFFTPLAYGGVCALMVVAFLTNHLKNGFFLDTSTEGYEYVVTVAVVCITLGTVGPGGWSLDNSLDFVFPFDPGKALLITALVGIGGAALFLLTFWRPPKSDPASSASHMGSVALDHVTKRFDDTTAVDDLTLEVADEEFLVLLGPSGRGKSTALRMLAGLEHPTDGTIRIGGRVVNEVEPKDRDVAMVFQSYALYPHMTVRRNIEFPLRSRKVEPAERRRLVTEAADALDLGEYLDRKPAELSGGQRQRVALARAIVRRPQAFLMDEPLSNLDAKLRVQTRAELVELQRRLAATVVYVTHDQVEAMTMGHRIAILERGVLQQVAPPQDVYACPANLFVARFIGSPPMNTVTGAVVSAGTGGDGLALELPGTRIPLPAPLAAMVRDAGVTDVVVGARPEDLRFAGPGQGIPADVVAVESLGHERHVACRLADGQLVIVRQAVQDAAPAPDEQVHVLAHVDTLHLFDPAGPRIG